MGIDFSHCGAHWAYSGFNRFRERIAGEIGINLRDMEGFSGFLPTPNQEEKEALKWNKIIDPIKLLLNHSDCDGILTPEECAKVAPRLREIISDWDDEDYDKQNAIELAEGMEQASFLGEDLEFG